MTGLGHASHGLGATLTTASGNAAHGLWHAALDHAVHGSCAKLPSDLVYMLYWD